MKILFYQPYNQAVGYIESIAEQFVIEGHDVFFISHDVKGDTHRNLESIGCTTYSFPVEKKNVFLYYFKRVSILAGFCNKNKIDIVYSHFQEANIIAVIAQYFCKAEFVITRHHSDCAFVDFNRKEKYADKLINLLARVYIAPSKKVKDQIVRVEKADPGKVLLINYGYNFNNYPPPDPVEVEKIKNEFKADLLLVKSARFITEKRHASLLEAIYELKHQGYDVKLLLLGKGPERDQILKNIKLKDLEDIVFLLGFKQNIFDYYAAADLVVHFSSSEASNSAVKEAGICGTPAAVCTDVGDFDDYIIDRKNGFLLNKDNPSIDFVAVVKKILDEGLNLERMGDQLKKTVIDIFNIQNVIGRYKEIHQERMNKNDK